MIYPVIFENGVPSIIDTTIILTGEYEIIDNEIKFIIYNEIYPWHIGMYYMRKYGIQINGTNYRLNKNETPDEFITRISPMLNKAIIEFHNNMVEQTLSNID